MSKFRGKSRPVFLFVKDGKVVRSQVGANLPKLLDYITELAPAKSAYDSENLNVDEDKHRILSLRPVTPPAEVTQAYVPPKKAAPPPTAPVSSRPGKTAAAPPAKRKVLFVVGISGAGKVSLAKRLAASYGLHIVGPAVGGADATPAAAVEAIKATQQQAKPGSLVVVVGFPRNEADVEQWAKTGADPETDLMIDLGLTEEDAVERYKLKQAEEGVNEPDVELFLSKVRAELATADRFRDEVVKSGCSSIDASDRDLAFASARTVVERNLWRIVAVVGPPGAGLLTVSRTVADRLGMVLIVPLRSAESVQDKADHIRDEMRAAGKTEDAVDFLIAGFPRDSEELAAFVATSLGGGGHPTPLKRILHLDAPEEYTEEHTIARDGSLPEGFSERYAARTEALAPVVKEAQTLSILSSIAINTGTTQDDIRDHMMDALRASGFQKIAAPVQRSGSMNVPAAAQHSSSPSKDTGPSAFTAVGEESKSNSTSPAVHSQASAAAPVAVTEPQQQPGAAGAAPAPAPAPAKPPASTPPTDGSPAPAAAAPSTSTSTAAAAAAAAATKGPKESSRKPRASAPQIVRLKLACRGLAKMDRFGKPDPYIVVSKAPISFSSSGGETAQGVPEPAVHKTETVSGTTDPDFVPFTTRVSDLTNNDDSVPDIVLEVFDEDSGKDDFIGKATVTLSQLAKKGAVVPIVGTSGKAAGEIHVVDAEVYSAKVPDVFFVLGGPGSGKGTQCDILVKELGMAHLSAGDLLREEVASGSQAGEDIKKMMAEGALVPVETTITLLRRAMDRVSDDTKFLIDGFPRALDQLDAFERLVGPARFTLFYECGEEELQRRLIERGKTSGRPDDNAESIVKRFRTYMDATMPVINRLEMEGSLRRIDATRSIEAVSRDSLKLIRDALGLPDPGVKDVALDFAPDVFFVLGGPGSGKGTQSDILVKELGMAHLSAGDLLREEVASGSPEGESIKKMMAEGALVPQETTIRLLKKAIAKAGKEAKFLIDGFPRALDQLDAFTSSVGPCRFCVFYECGEEELQRRLIERGKTSGRPDDNAESIVKRFRTYMDATMPVIQRFEEQGLLRKIDAARSIEAVAKDSLALFREALGVPEPDAQYAEESFEETN